MSRHMVPVMLGLAVFSAAAIAIAAYLAVTAGPGMAAVAGAILLLAVCVVAIASVALVKLSRHDEWLAAQQDQIQFLSGRSEDAVARMLSLEERQAEPEHRIESLAGEVSFLRREVRDIAYAQTAATEVPPQPEVRRKPAVPALIEKGQESLALQLEPVIDLAAGSTSHYRALLSLVDGQGGAVPYDNLIQKADQGGMRPALDVRLVRLVAPVLRRLRLKNPVLRVFVQIGRTTLGAREEAGRLLALLQRDGDVAGGIVFEFSQQDIGRLEGPGIETLARLARSGATLALRDVSVGGLDLGALRQLGVRYLTFPPHAVDAGQGPSAVWNEFVRNAQALQIQLIVGSIKTPQQATAANKFARFGFGPFFAPPRKVKADAGIAAAVASNANVA